MEAKNKKLDELYRLAIHHNLCRSKAEFADFIGVDKTTLSRALMGRKDVNPQNAIRKAENALLRAGVSLESVILSDSDGANVIGNNNMVGIPPKKFAHDKKLLALLEEKDKQIARLLGIIETLSAKVHD